ncbi:PAS domain S-box-containing protein [Pedobacter sp. CG_S7]|uniref:PAS domain-containing protein n=1 Tax=Pedobacter sp. CG_S7 TaxID=3143930 RepID=UPI003397B3FA
MKEHFNFSKWPAEKQEEKVLMSLDPHQPGNNTKEKTPAVLDEFDVISLTRKKLNSQLKKSYQSLIEKHETFISLYNFAPVGCLILDYAGVIIDINQRGADLLKMPKDSIIDKRFHSFIPKDNLGDFYDFLQQIKKSATRQSMEIRLTLNAYEHAYARIEGIAIQNQSATKIKYYITVFDITANRKSQFTLQQTKDHSRLLLCNSNSGIWAIRTADNTVYLDDNSCTILGLKPSQFDGSINQIMQCVHNDDREKTRFCLEDGIALNKEIDTEFRVINNTGQLKFISFKGHEVANFKKEGMCYSGILLDYSEPKRLEEEAKDLRRKQDRLILSATLTAQEKERS